MGGDVVLSVLGGINQALYFPTLTVSKWSQQMERIELIAHISVVAKYAAPCIKIRELE